MDVVSVNLQLSRPHWLVEHTFRGEMLLPSALTTIPMMRWTTAAAARRPCARLRRRRTTAAVAVSATMAAARAPRRRRAVLIVVQLLLMMIVIRIAPGRVSAAATAATVIATVPIAGTARTVSTAAPVAAAAASFVMWRWYASWSGASIAASSSAATAASAVLIALQQKAHYPRKYVHKSYIKVHIILQIVTGFRHSNTSLVTRYIDGRLQPHNHENDPQPTSILGQRLHSR